METKKPNVKYKIEMTFGGETYVEKDNFALSKFQEILKKYIEKTLQTEVNIKVCDIEWKEE